MPTIDPKDRPDYQRKAFTNQLPAMTTVRDVICGTEAVRKKRETYLPKGPLETRGAYDSRLRVADVYPATRRTWTGLLGLLFKKPPVLGESVPVEIAGKKSDTTSEVVDGWQKNIDNAGTSLNEFVKEFAGNALEDGHCVILVDMPPKVRRADGQPATLEDETKAGIRPYWTIRRKDQIINWQEEQRQGKTVLALVMIEECLTVPDGMYGEKEAKQYREYRNDNGLITAQIKRKVEKPNSTEVEFVAVGPPVVISNQTEIPICPAYARKKGTFQSEPMLVGLAEENLRHYRLRTYLEKQLVLSFPIPVSKGKVRNLGVPADAKQDLALSPDEILEIDDTQHTDFKLVEPTGAGIAPLAQEIKDCESRMARLGLSLLEPAQQSGKTNTEASGDQIEEQSELDFFRSSVEQAVMQALMFSARFAGLQNGGTFKLESALSKFKLTSEKIKIFSEMVERAQFPVEDFLALLRQADELPDSFDVEKALVKLEAEKEKAAERAASVFNRGELPADGDIVQ